MVSRELTNVTGRPSRHASNTVKITVILIFVTEHYLASANSHIATRKSDDAEPKSDHTEPEKATIRGQEKQRYGARKSDDTGPGKVMITTGPGKATILSLNATIRSQKKRQYGARKSNNTRPEKATIRGQGKKRRYEAKRSDNNF